MDYSKLSDWEISVLVGEAQGLANKIAAQNGMRDYCKKPADAWPIVESNLIRMTPIAHSGEVIWVASRDIHAHCNAKPFRAAMIVFLMMQEQK